jgi:ABC-type nickel/cobalt efflux system permease component RcnA
VLGVDQWIGHLAAGGSPALVLAIAILLGLRHASDPDHLVAVSTLVATEPDRPLRRAARLGLSWGLGHATTLIALGLPIVLFGRYLPEPLQRAAEAAVGLVILAFALRLLRRWRAGAFHSHPHAHGPVVHRHLHGHSGATGCGHEHRPPATRSAAQSFGIGLVHGMGGSAGVGLLVLAPIRRTDEAMAALALFAAAAALSMAALSAGAGYALARPPVRRRLPRLIPAFGVGAAVFGALYAAGALI